MIYTQVQKPLIPAQWYEILKLKKVEVIAQLTARSISHNITTHIMTLKSKLYKAIKQGVKSLTEQFNAVIGDDWKEAFKKSGKTFKNFKRDLLLKFHPDKHSGSQEATIITQTINGWIEPTCYDDDYYFRQAYGLDIDEEIIRDASGEINETFYRKVNKWEWSGMTYAEIYEELSIGWAKRHEELMKTDPVYRQACEANQEDYTFV